jgi:branched-chain amino acid transport system substrate-binding protein
MEEQNLMGMDYSAYFQKEVSARKFTNYVIQKYQRFSSDFSNSILAFKKAGVDLVYAPMIGPDGILFWKQMKQLDFNPKATIMLIAPAARRDWKGMGKDGDYDLTSAFYHWALPYPGVKEFAAAYRADNKGENPTELAGAAYACMQVIKDAIERAGSLDRDKIRNAVAGTDLMTIVGPVRFLPNGLSISKPFIVQYINGKETIVWPKEMAEREPVYPFPAWKAR